MQAERTDHLEVEVEHDISSATVSLRAFHQHTSDQLVTVFGINVPGGASQLGHYFIGNAGDIDTTGLSVGIRTSIAGRVHGSVEYSTARGRMVDDPSYLWILSPSSARADLERIHDVATSV